MAKGTFINADGTLAYYGERKRKPQLEATCTWVDGPSPPAYHRWNGVQWVADNTLRPAQVSVDDVLALLVSKGALTNSDVTSLRASKRGG